MNYERNEIMEKARAKRFRRARMRNTRDVTGARATSFTEKVMDLAQETAARVGSLVKTAARTISGART
jgi:hypothetical protein